MLNNPKDLSSPGNRKPIFRASLKTILVPLNTTMNPSSIAFLMSVTFFTGTIFNLVRTSESWQQEVRLLVNWKSKLCRSLETNQLSLKSLLTLALILNLGFLSRHFH